MLSKNQIKLLYKYTTALPAEQSNLLFNELTQKGYIDRTSDKKQELYSLTSKGFAELESAKHASTTLRVSGFALVFAIISVILTVIFKFC